MDVIPDAVREQLKSSGVQIPGEDGGMTTGSETGSRQQHQSRQSPDSGRRGQSSGRAGEGKYKGQDHESEGKRGGKPKGKAKLKGKGKGKGKGKLPPL